MTALTSSRHDPAEGIARLSPLPGFTALVRKELTEWRRGRRTWVVLIVSSLFMALSALNTWLQANLPAGGAQGAPNPVVEPLVIVANSVGTQIFSLAAIFAVMSLLVAEREAGTLAWTASKPVSRAAIWLSKFATASAILWLVAALVPLAVTIALVYALYGPMPLGPVAIMALGMGLSVAFYVAVTLAVSTLITSQAAVAAIAIGVMFLPQLLGFFLPAQFLPQSVLQWSIVTAAGQPASLVTPAVTLLSVALIALLAVRQLDRTEL